MGFGGAKDASLARVDDKDASLARGVTKDASFFHLWHGALPKVHLFSIPESGALTAPAKDASFFHLWHFRRTQRFIPKTHLHCRGLQ